MYVINIFTSAPGGTAGDPALCKVLIELLLKQYGDNIIVNMNIIPPITKHNSQLEKYISIFNDMPMNVRLRVYGFQEEQWMSKKYPKCDRAIVFPIPWMLNKKTYKNIFESLNEPKSEHLILGTNYNPDEKSIKKESFIKTLKLDELKNSKIILLGLNQGLSPQSELLMTSELIEAEFTTLQPNGILFDFGTMYSKLDNSIMTGITTEKMARFKTVSPGLYAEIFGDKEPDETDNTACYFSYTNNLSSCDASIFDLEKFFHLCLINAESEGKSDISIVMRVHNDNEQSHITGQILDKKSSFESIIQHLDEDQYTVSFRYKKDGVFHQRVWGNGDTNVRIINPFGIPHEEMLILNQISHPITMQTGNSSYFEALACGKIPFYQVTSWSKGFNNALISEITEKAQRPGFSTSCYGQILEEVNSSEHVDFDRDFLEELNSRISANMQKLQAEVLVFKQWLSSAYSSQNSSAMMFHDALNIPDAKLQVEPAELDNLHFLDGYSSPLKHNNQSNELSMIDSEDSADGYVSIEDNLYDKDSSGDFDVADSSDGSEDHRVEFTLGDKKNTGSLSIPDNIFAPVGNGSIKRFFNNSWGNVFPTKEHDGTFSLRVLNYFSDDSGNTTRRHELNYENMRILIDTLNFCLDNEIDIGLNETVMQNILNKLYCSDILNDLLKNKLYFDIKNLYNLYEKIVEKSEYRCESVLPDYSFEYSAVPYVVSSEEFHFCIQNGVPLSLISKNFDQISFMRISAGLSFNYYPDESINLLIKDDLFIKLLRDKIDSINKGDESVTRIPIAFWKNAILNAQENEDNSFLTELSRCNPLVNLYNAIIHDMNFINSKPKHEPSFFDLLKYFSELCELMPQEFFEDVVNILSIVLKQSFTDKTTVFIQDNLAGFGEIIKTLKSLTKTRIQRDYLCEKFNEILADIDVIMADDVNDILQSQPEKKVSFLIMKTKFSPGKVGVIDGTEMKLEQMLLWQLKHSINQCMGQLNEHTMCFDKCHELDIEDERRGIMIQSKSILFFEESSKKKPSTTTAPEERFSP